MVGRGVFQDPYVFAEQSPWVHTTPDERIALYRKQVELFAATWQNRERNIKTLNRFCKIYINGFDGASDMRVALMEAADTNELLRLLAAAEPVAVS